LRDRLDLNLVRSETHEMRRTWLSLLGVFILAAAFRGLEDRYARHGIPPSSPVGAHGHDSGVGHHLSVRSYVSTLVPVTAGLPILADFPEFVEPIGQAPRFEARSVVAETSGDLEVRAWRYSYNARGIVETVNRLEAAATAILVVHPWGIDDGQGWQTPEPAGVAFFCTPDKNQFYRRHIREVVQPFLHEHRGKVRVIGYSLPGKEDAIRRKLYTSVHGQPTAQQRAEGRQELDAALKSFVYQAEPLPHDVTLATAHPLADHLHALPTLDSGARYNGPGYWDLPIPVVSDLKMDPADVVFYDDEGYPALRDYLRRQGVRHVLLAGYCTDMCLISTTAGYKNLSADFNVFIVGDATLASFPAAATPRFATNAALCQASLSQFITQVLWVRSLATPTAPVSTAGAGAAAKSALP
jgi:nicotinamidase-related amidase